MHPELKLRSVWRSLAGWDFEVVKIEDKAVICRRLGATEAARNVGDDRHGFAPAWFEDGRMTLLVPDEDNPPPKAVTRTIELTLSDDFFDMVGGNHDKRMHAALGKLAAWGSNSPKYAKVVVRGSTAGHLDATYRDAAGEVTYSMSAVRGEGGDYSTHS